ncbi:hypothetical protein I4U23_023681 [Adineta vaga]|nr:hypothetical protein I4U23_023681 [Adineta vaga]
MNLVSKRLNNNLTSKIFTDNFSTGELLVIIHFDLGISNSSYIEVTYKCRSNNLYDQAFARETLTNLRSNIEIDQLREKLASSLYNPTTATVPDIIRCGSH